MKMPYKNGKKDGTNKYYYDNGALMASLLYIKGEKTGKYHSYHKNRNIMTIRFYVNDMIDGTDISYYTNGNLKRKYNYKNDKLHGLKTEYYKNGKIKSKTNYKNGQKHGLKEEYEQNGNLESKENYKNNEFDGLVEYYDNGRLKMAFNYTNGEVRLATNTYFENGNPRNIIRTDGKDGWQRFSKNGNIYLDYYFTKENNNTYEYKKSYSKKGILEYDLRRIKKINGVNYKDVPHPDYAVDLDGKQRWYYKSGNLKLESIYKNGVPISSKSYNDNPNKSKKGIISYVKDLFKNKNELKDGIEKSYYPDGNIMFESSYKKGVLDGTTKMYYQTGGLFREEIYKDGKRVGTKVYKKDGTRKFPNRQ